MTSTRRGRAGRGATGRGAGPRDPRRDATNPSSRVVTMSIRLIPGVCFVCDCTEEMACSDVDGPCCWVDAEQTLCSACERKGLLFLEWMVAGSPLLEKEPAT